MNELFLPELGEGIQTVKVVSWSVQEGDAVQVNQDVVDVVTDKAVFTLPADKPGVIKKILAKEGEEVAVGSALAIIQPLNLNRENDDTKKS